MKEKIEIIQEKQGTNGSFWGVKIGGQWANCFDKKIGDKKSGDEIEYNLISKGKFNNLELVDEIPEKDINSDIQSSPMVATPVINLRVEAMKLAVEYMASSPVPVEELENYANKFLTYIEEPQPF